MTGASPRPVPRVDTILEYARRFPECDPESMRGYLLVRVLMARLDQALEQHLSRHHLSFGRFMVLMHLIQAEGHALTPAELSSRCGVTRATMTGLLDTLEKAKLVVREDDPEDGRSFLVRLTVGGRRFLGKLLPDHFTRLTRMMSVLSAAELKQLQRLTGKLSQAVGALGDP